METIASLATTRRTTGRRWMLVLMAGLVVLAAVLAGGCSSDSSETIHGTWHWPKYGVYEILDEDGTFSVYLSRVFGGNPYDWGTYTFDGEVLTYQNAEGSVCPGATAVWTVEFAEGGDEARQTLVEDSCSGSDRSVDRVLVRYSP